MRAWSLAAALWILSTAEALAAEAAGDSEAPRSTAGGVQPEASVHDESAAAVAPTWRRFRLLAGASGVVDVVGRGAGPAVSATLGYDGFEVATRVMIGTRPGVGAQASFTLLPDGLSPRLGGRFTVFPGAAAFGGGPVLGLRFPFTAGLSAFIEGAAEFFATTPAHRPFAITVAGGLELELVSGT